MAKIIDETDKKYGKLTPIKVVGKNKHGQILWLCECDCGNQTTLVGGTFRSGHTKSCGCLRYDNLFPEGKAAFNRMVANIKRGAKARGYLWELSNEQVKLMADLEKKYNVTYKKYT